MTGFEQFFPTAVALLVFTLAFYTLIARERKTPSVVTAVYNICLVGFVLIIAASLIQVIVNVSEIQSRSQFTSDFLPPILVPTAVAFCAAFIMYRVLIERNRHNLLRTDNMLFSLIPRRCHYLWYRFRKQEYVPLEFEAQLLSSIKSSPHLPGAQMDNAIARQEKIGGISLTAAILGGHLSDANEIMLDLAKRFLTNGGIVFYLTCSRHPYEFVKMLQSSWTNSDWSQVRKRVFLVDAYSPHFGFSEFVHAEKHKEASELVNTCFVCETSYAGIHSGLARLYKSVRIGEKGEFRLPILVIYEGCHALVDLESREQYRVFVRHVLPSERIWGGMMSVFLEAFVDADSKAVLKQSADIFVELPEEKRPLCAKNS